MLYYINFHASARNWEEIQNGNNGKHETVVIKYLAQRKKTLENSNKKLNEERLKNCMFSACPQKYPEEQWKRYVLYWYS